MSGEDRGPARERRVALACCAAGAVLVLTAAGRSWAQVRVAAAPGLPAFRHGVPGTVVAGPVRALALVGLASVAALIAVRGRARNAVGAVLLVLGTGVIGYSWAGAHATPSASAVTGGVAGVRATGAGVLVVSRTAWPAPAIAGGLLLVLAGALALAHGHRWPSLGRRYDAPTAQRSTDPAAGDVRAPAAEPSGATSTDAGLWAALDRGEDPTGHERGGSVQHSAGDGSGPAAQH